MDKKILVDCRRINDKTGLSSYIIMILKALNTARGSYYLLVNENAKDFDFSQYIYETKINLVYCNSKPFSLKSNIEIPLIINRYKFGIFHSTHMDIPLGIVFCPHCKLITTIHDIMPIKYPHLYKTNLVKRVYFELMFRACACISDKILTVSNYSKKDLISFLHIKDNKISVIYNSFEEKNLDRNKNNKNDNIVKLFFVGTNFKHKNIHVVIEAVKLLKDKGYNILFNVAGAERQYTDYLRELIQKLGLNDNVKILGKISDEKLELIYKSTDIFVYPPLVEGFGIPLLEAMNYGIPVISSNETCLPEVVGDAGIVIKPTPENFAEKIELLINDENLKNDLILKGYQRVKYFSQEGFNKSILEEYYE